MALIEREALLDIAEQQGHITVDDIVNLPTIEAATVVPGRWMFNADMWTWDCTSCKGWVGSGIMISRYKHCPNCGARMDGGDRHEAD